MLLLHANTFLLTYREFLSACWCVQDDNMWFQWFSLVGLMIFTLEFVVQFFMNIVPGSKYHIEAHYDAKVGFNRTALGPDLLPVFSLGGQVSQKTTCSMIPN